MAYDLHHEAAEQSQQPWWNSSGSQTTTFPGLRSPPSINTQPDAPQLDTHSAEQTQTQDTSNTQPDVVMAGSAETNGTGLHSETTNTRIPATNGNGSQDILRPQENGAVNEAHPHMNGDAQQGGTVENGDVLPSPPAEDNSETASQQTAHRMTTRARAHAASKSPSPPFSPSSTTNPIHPLFLFSTDLIPDRDFGLPPAEAEDTRMLLLALVQKQEEIARAASDLHHGMLQGERMRQDVFKWAKAEAHVGEMSDGEDWYDKEEWGLEQDLMKGKDEEEDDGAVQGKKTTRRAGRRAVDKE